MSASPSLEGLQSLHGELVAICEHRFESVQNLEQELSAHLPTFSCFLDKPPRNQASRDKVQSGVVDVDGDAFRVNSEFQGYCLQLADELDLDELEAAKLLIQAQEAQITLGRPLLECAIIRFHQQRKYQLECMRLLIEIADDDGLDAEMQQGFEELVAHHVFGAPLPGTPAPPAAKRIAPRCMAAMALIKQWLQKLSDKAVLAQASGSRPAESETVEFCRLSLIQQHEVLAVILCAAIDKRHTQQADFEGLLRLLKQVDKYDHLLVHLFPVLGAYIRVYGSVEGIGDVTAARALNANVIKPAEDDSWPLPFLHAAVRAWWIVEYSGWYVDGPADDPSIDIDKEDKERSKQFTEALKEGSFDFILSVAADVQAPEWQDPSRIGIRQWLQRKSPALATESVPFSDYFQQCLMSQLEDFIDAFISNLPDVLRKLRVEEDEQRQLSQFHEQDLDLERFLVIISYAYEGRPEAADSFWSDPESNLAGFVQWASKRASTPLVCAFCEMLQSISENESCALSSHEFLLDEGHHATVKMRKTQSLTWSQIFKELHFFVSSIRERPSPQQHQSQGYRTGKPGGGGHGEQAEAEPESAMLLECYLRLIAKLATKSAVARNFLLRNQDFPLVDVILQLASSNIPPRLRACGFYALSALITPKTQEDGNVMWQCLDSFISGGYQAPSSSPRGLTTAGPNHGGVPAFTDALFEEIGSGFEEPNAFVRFLVSLVAPWEGASPLMDGLPFPEGLGSSVRLPGIEPYIDFALGHVFGAKSKELQDVSHLRVLRMSCLDFALVCLNTFNEDLIVLGNETNIAVDQAIATTDLAAYVRLHPFARVMEWMFNGSVVDALFSTVHQDSNDIGSASPESPLILGLLRAVEVISRVLDLQATYLDIVRPVIRRHAAQQRQRPVPHAAYTGFEEAIMNHLEIISDLGRYCGVGHPDLTMACLKLLERISTSSKIVSAWNPGAGGHSYRNKAVVALEKGGEADSVSGALIAELASPLDVGLQAASPNYQIKLYILDFLYGCLRVSANTPTIAHLLLGFKCAVNSVRVEPRSRFDERTSLFHTLIRVLLEAPFGDETLGMQSWLVSLKYRILRILRLLWRSPISSSIVMDELRRNDIVLHLILREETLQGNLVWDGMDMNDPGFLLSPAAPAFVEFLSMRQMTLEYITAELCTVAQNRLPSRKRQIFDALNGHIKGVGREAAAQINQQQTTPTIFDLFDFLPQDGQWRIPPPNFSVLKDLELRVCVEEDANGSSPTAPTTVPTYNIERVKQLLLLKGREESQAGKVVTREEAAAIDREETLLIEYLVFTNHQALADAERRRVLTAWVDLLLVMFEASDQHGPSKTAFLLHVLQTILPTLEAYGSERPVEAYELARLAKVLLFKLDFLSPSSPPLDATAAGVGRNGAQNGGVGGLVSEKILRLFEVCLHSVSRRAGGAKLRSVYYAICYRYLTGIAALGNGGDGLPVGGRRMAARAVQLSGERLMTVVCDDAFGGDPDCQTAALVLLGELVSLDTRDGDVRVIEALNRLNFVAILVDSLKTVLDDMRAPISAASQERTSQQQETSHSAKLALLLQLCQTREGAKYVLQANLFRAVEQSRLFTDDPELQIDPNDTKALADHYALLVKVARVVGAAVVSRGAHNVAQGRRFLTEHRMLVVHVLKRSAGIGAVDQQLEERVVELADAFMVLIIATGFLDFEESQLESHQQKQGRPPTLFH